MVAWHEVPGIHKRKEPVPARVIRRGRAGTRPDRAALQNTRCEVDG